MTRMCAERRDEAIRLAKLAIQALTQPLGEGDDQEDGFDDAERFLSAGAEVVRGK